MSRTSSAPEQPYVGSSGVQPPPQEGPAPGSQQPYAARPELAEQPRLAEQRGADPGVPPRTGLWVGAGLMALAAIAGMGMLVGFALHSARGLSLDQRMMNSVGNSAMTAMKITDWLTYVSVGGVAVCLAACAAVAVMRGRWSLAVAAAVLVVGANITTRILKFRVFDRADGLANSLPSGHTTVAVSLGLAAVIVAPAAWRWVVVPVAGFAGTFVGAGTVVGQWHRPSDVLAALMVCLGWTAVALGVAALLDRRPHTPRSGWAARSSLALLGAAAVGLCFVGWGLRPTDHDVNLTLAVLALAPIGVGVAALVTWTAALTERHLA